MLRTENLTKDYGPVRALDGLTLAVRPGEVFGILGPNGSGKTTALRVALGFLKPTAGRAFIGPHDCWADGVNARRLVAYLPGELRLYENMTGRQLIRFLCTLRDHAVTADLDALAKRFEIDLDRPLAHLSSGMKRKVALLQVLTPAAPLLIMDEPTNALDPSMRDELLHQVRRARERGQTVVFSSHVLSEVEAVCDRVAIFRQGKLAHLQVLAELQRSRLVTARFAAPPGPLPELPGAHVRACDDAHLSLEYGGPLPELLAWLSERRLTALSIEPLGLGAVYYRHHGAEA
jgi:beta-exotoxin I transport system ATP-binding protein